MRPAGRHVTMDLDGFLALPRLSGLTLSPDGDRLVVSAATPGDGGKRFRSALWELDPDGNAEAVQLTRSAKGESGAVFGADGRLWFTSPRPDPDDPDDDRVEPALWELPERGEAILRLELPAGVSSMVTARSTARGLVTSTLFPAASSLDEDEERAKAREEAGVSAQLYDDYPIRQWDRWLGPREPAIFLVDLDVEGRLAPSELLRGRQFEEVSSQLTPQGEMAVVTVRRIDEPDVRDRALDIMVLDVASGERRTLLADGNWYHMLAVSPDGSRVAAVRETLGDPETTADEDLVIVRLDDGVHEVLDIDREVWPWNPTWSPDGSALYFDADEQGHHPVFRLDLETGETTRLTADGAYTDLCVHPDGRRVFALRSTMSRPPHPVVLDATNPDQDPVELPSPVLDAAGAGRLERLVATADDGVEVPAWLVLPSTASEDEPVPLVVFIHGGPLNSWNSWHWRWNPHLLAEHGYAVLLSDPALSTGYGQEFVRRGWGSWGERPYTDLMTAVEAAVARPDLDQDRVAAMGGSFGGYMANWVAGHTDRFRCIVTHASLWHLEGFHGTTDLGPFWEREFGDPYEDPARYRDNSPHRFVDRIDTPMLVIHGEKDYRVPISEALTLWTDLSRHGVDARFLYFPDENHWVLKPNNARIWYRTVAAFLDEHLRGMAWERPELL